MSWINKFYSNETINDILYSKRSYDGLFYFITNDSKLNKNSWIYDQCCGLGFLTIKLKESGFNNVYSLDFQESNINILRDELIDKGLDANFLIAKKAEDFIYVDFFNTIINIYSSIGHISRDADLKVFTNNFLSLKKDGCFYLEYLNLNYLKNNFKQEIHYDNIKRLSKIDGNKMIQTWVLKDQEIETEMQLYFVDELVLILKNIGFTDVKLIDSKTYKEFDHQTSERVLIKATK